MLPDIALEALRYFDRTTLEGLQMHSRNLRDLVDRHASTLPLRHIFEVETERGDILVHLAQDDNDRIDVGQAGGRDLADLELLNDLRTNGDDLQCQIKFLCVAGTAAAIDYPLVEFLGAHLKPQVCETLMYYCVDLEDAYAVLFAHNALRGIVTQMVHKTCARAPDCVITELFGAGVVETCTISAHMDPRPWIVKFIEMFETAERGTKIVGSVTLLHLRYGDASPLRHTVEPLRQPLRTDAPTPHSDFIKEWLQEELRDVYEPTESPVAELFVFENANAAKKLEMLVWTVEQTSYNGPHSLHYAFFLGVTDM